MAKPNAHVMEGAARFGETRAQGDMFISDADKSLWHGLEYFPTPPWAVRAMWSLMKPRLGLSTRYPTIYEPCAGRGHIVKTLEDMGEFVVGSDLHDHGAGYRIHDARDLSAFCLGPYPLMVSNPPFKLAEDIVQAWLAVVPHVIVLCRLSFLNSAGRYPLHFANPTGNLKTFLPCIERVPMVLGRYDPQATTATEFAWFHYEAGYAGAAELVPVPPGSREALQRKEDVRI